MPARESMTIIERDSYVICGGESRGEWIRMDWRSDVPKSTQKRKSLLQSIEQ